jgi:hypothetical protein
MAVFEGLRDLKGNQFGSLLVQEPLAVAPSAELPHGSLCFTTCQ